jgi:hypothetical protein
MSQPKHEPEAAKPPRVRHPWEPLTLTAIGNVKDLVRGGPKTGGGADGEGVRKPPVTG